MIEHRAFWLMLGLIAGLFSTLLIAKYEAILYADIRLAFFIPIVVYVSAAAGVQTTTIYIRALASKRKIDFHKYLLKETINGVGLGIIAGIVLGAFAYFWLHSTQIAWTLAFTMLINLTIAPALGVFVPRLLYKERADPALGSGPVDAIVQDIISLLIYLFMASIFIL